MTAALDFTKPARLRKAAPGMYRHDGDRFPGLYLNVGKTKNTWYIKRKVEGKTKSIKIGGFPAMDAATAFKREGRTDAERVVRNKVSRRNPLRVHFRWRYLFRHGGGRGCNQS